MKSYIEYRNAQVKEFETYDNFTRNKPVPPGANFEAPFRDCNIIPDNSWKGKIPMNSLEATDAESKAVQKTPNRVALADIESAIMHVEYINPVAMPHLTIAVVYLQNGWAEVGHSAPADVDNFDAELGKKLARENAIRHLWPLFGFALREKLYQKPEPYTGVAAEHAENNAKLDPDDL